MPSLNVTRSYANGTVLLEADLDAFLDDIKALVNVTLLDDSNFQSNGISTAKLIDSSVTTAKLADSAITAAKITDANVTTAKIADANITTAKIADLAVTTAKITDANITTAKIADSAITLAEEADPGIQISSSTSTFSSASSSATSVTNASVTITTTGRPVWLQLQHDGSSNTGYIGTPLATGSDTNINTVFLHVYFYRDATEIAKFRFGNQRRYDTSAQTPLSTFAMIDTADVSINGVAQGPAAGTYTYTAKIGWATNEQSVIRCYYAKLVAFEL